MRKGIAVSPGVAVGTAYVIHEIFVAREGEQLDGEQVNAEVARYERACEQTADDLRALIQKVASQVGATEAGVFQSQLTILHDAAFTKRVRNWIVKERQPAQAALRRLLDEYTRIFARISDDYLRERLTDIRDVIVRLSSHLTEVLKPGSRAISGPLILIADELLPSQVVAIGDRPVAGIITQTGGTTSHAAILARSRGIPAVTGVRGILRQVRNGATVVVDGRDGHVIVNPSPEVTSAYRKLQREFVHLKDSLASNFEQPAVSADGEAVELLANINHLADATTARTMGASGVGLYRTEYLFLTHPDVPDEDEQLATYREVIAASPNRRVTIRTLDLGGDKTIPYLGHSREANPFLGWRSIRLSFEHPEFFAAQIRAVLRAAATADEKGPKSDVRLLFPMITTLEEIRRVRAMVRRAGRALDRQKQPWKEVPIGLMIEVPAAAVTIDNLLDVVDFVSIGSNDLVQYLMAADRDNPKVSHLCQPLSPPVLRVLDQVIRACRRAAKPVTLCGEMAGDPPAFLLLYGMGLRSFSMSPAFIPAIKELVSHLTRADTRQLLQEVLELKTAAQIARVSNDRLASIAPKLAILGTR
ncbi:MAG: phosphoenolpyruvate--protein phosphotransferase [Pirellulales bacterium]|nr:phosphoenolpyruvate--protein phosphotransferase [Pirellulales bacterium]